MMAKSFLFITLLALLTDCKPKSQRLIESGYQIFEEYHFAIKVPCKLEIDSTVRVDPFLGQSLIMVCPQVFIDSSRTFFDINKLLETNRNIYHLKFLRNEDHMKPVEILNQQKEILDHLGISESLEISVDGTNALIYHIQQKMTTEAFFTLNDVSYYIAVTGDSSRSELNKVLEGIKLGI